MTTRELIGDIIIPYMRQTGTDRKLSTRKREGDVANHLAAWFGHGVISDAPVPGRITGDDVRRYREHRKLVGGVSPETVKRELALASKAVNYAISEWGLDLINPFHKRLISRRDRLAKGRSQPRVVTPTEEARLKMASPPWLRDVIEFALGTGMRQGEILDLTWGRVDGDTVYFRGGLDQKNGREGWRIMSAAAQAVVARQVQRCEYVFNLDGQRIARSRLHSWWHKARTKADCPDVKFHDLRKTFGSRMLESGAAMEEVQAQLGHSDIRTTQMIYAASPLERMRRAMGRM